MNPITQFFVDLITTLQQGISGPIQPLIALIGTTPLQFTTATAVVIGGWNTMTAVADAFLGLIVVVAAIQIR